MILFTGRVSGASAIDPFIDGRIKGYPKYKPGSNNSVPRSMYFRMVRGNPDYGKNDFSDNGNNTITDNAMELMWMQNDSGMGMNWKDALEYAEDCQGDQS